MASINEKDDEDNYVEEKGLKRTLSFAERSALEKAFDVVKA